MNAGSIYLFKLVFFFCFGTSCKSGIAQSYARSMFNFLRNFILFSTVTALSYIPLTLHKVSLISAFTLTLVICWFLIIVIFDMCDVTFHYSFGCISELFMCLLTIYMSLGRENYDDLNFISLFSFSFHCLVFFIKDIFII